MSQNAHANWRKILSKRIVKFNIYFRMFHNYCSVKKIRKCCRLSDFYIYFSDLYEPLSIIHQFISFVDYIPHWFQVYASYLLFECQITLETERSIFLGDYKRAIWSILIPSLLVTYANIYSYIHTNCCVVELYYAGGVWKKVYQIGKILLLTDFFSHWDILLCSEPFVCQFCATKEQKKRVSENLFICEMTTFRY